MPAARPPAEPPIDHFFTKVAGVTFPNADGSSRQRIIRKLSLYEQLILDTEPDNPKDPFAVRILRKNGQQVGYMWSKYGRQLHDHKAANRFYEVFVIQLTGGTDDKPERGVNLLVVHHEHDLPASQVQRYIKKLLKEIDAERSDDEGDADDDETPSRGCLGRLITYTIIALVVLYIASRLTG
jgi:hypothetical protein